MDFLRRSSYMLRTCPDKWSDEQWERKFRKLYCSKRDKEDYYETFVTNASAGSLNSGIRGFRAELHGISNLTYFFYRVCKIYG